MMHWLIYVAIGLAGLIAYMWIGFLYGIFRHRTFNTEKPSVCRMLLCFPFIWLVEGKPSSTEWSLVDCHSENDYAALLTIVWPFHAVIALFWLTCITVVVLPVWLLYELLQICVFKPARKLTKAKESSE